MHPWSPLMKLCATTVLPLLWFVGSSASTNTSVLHVSLAKFPLLLLANAERSQVEEATACFPGALICSGIFGQNCVPKMLWYSGWWEGLFGQKCHFQSSRGMLFASYIPALVSGVRLPREEATEALQLSLIGDLCNMEILDSMCACSEEEQEPGSNHTKRSY